MLCLLCGSASQRVDRSPRLKFGVSWLTGGRHMYGSRNLGNNKDEIQKGIKLSLHLAAALGVKVDTESQAFVGKVEGW